MSSRARVETEGEDRQSDSARPRSEMGKRSATVATPTPPGPEVKMEQERRQLGQSNERYNRHIPVEEKIPDTKRRMTIAGKLERNARKSAQSRLWVAPTRRRLAHSLWRQRTPDLDERKHKHRCRVDDLASVDLGQRGEHKRAGLVESTRKSIKVSSSAGERDGM